MIWHTELPTQNEVNIIVETRYNVVKYAICDYTAGNQQFHWQGTHTVFYEKDIVRWARLSDLIEQKDNK